MGTNSPACARHPHRPAAASCASCGAVLCARCTRDRAGLAWCGACGREAGAALVAAALDAGPAPAPPPPPPAVPSAPSTSVLRALAALAATVAVVTATALLLESRPVSAPLTPRVAVAPAPSPPATRSPAAPPAPAPSPARAATPPSLVPPAFAILPGDGIDDAVCLEGNAPGATTVLALVDGDVAATASVDPATGRFALGELDLPAGDHVLRVVSLDASGVSGESAPQSFRYTEAPVPAPPPPVATPPAIAALVTPAPAVPRERTPRPEPGAPVERPVPRLRVIAPEPRAPRERIEPTGRGVNIVRGPSDRIIALTFDGGSDAGAAYGVLDALRTKGVRSTLFLTGDFVRLYPEITRRIVADGHEVGNHTFTHLHIADWRPPRGHVTRSDVSREILVDELERTRALFERTTGVRMSRYWRAPYGEVNREIIGWAESAGWTHVGWTDGLDTLDWVADTKDRRYRSAPEIRERLLAAARKATSARGGIVLMHLGHERSDEDVPSAELPRIIDGLRDEGYRIVTVSALVGG